MKKMLYSVFISLLTLFLFLACEKKEAEITENKVSNEKIVNFTKKYLDFYSQEDNIFLVLSFEDKDFLEDELWKNIPQFEIQKAEKTETSNENYALIIPLKDGYTYEIRENVANSTEFKTLFLKALKRGETLIVKNWASLYTNTLIVKKENSDGESHEFNYYAYDGIPLFIDVFCENEKGINSDISQNIISTEEKDFQIYANAKLDLNQDGMDEEISFITQINEENMELSSGNKTKLLISNKIFEFSHLLALAGIEEGDLYWNSPILNMEILDIDKNDKYQELVFVVDGNRFAPSLGLFFHYDGNDLKYIGTVNHPLEENFTACVDSKSSNLKVKEWNNLLGFSSFQEKSYSIKENILQEVENISDIVFLDKKIIGIAKENIEVYKEKDSDELLFTTEKGDNLLFVSSNFKSWIEVKDFNSGKTGYLQFQVKENKYGEEMFFHKQEDLKDKTIQETFDNLPLNR